MPESPLVERVLSELRALRKDSAGVRVETLARASTICRLLGGGDPYLAYTRLQHALLDSSLDRTVRAAAASLGFASDGATHLDRLVEGGGDLNREQRQVRRLSDQGLVSIAQLIATNWTVASVPELTAFVLHEPTRHEIRFATSRPLVVEMSSPVVEVLIGDQRTFLDVDWDIGDDDQVEQSTTREPLRLERREVEVSISIVWRGELWPKFTTYWHGKNTHATSEMLGNKLMLRLGPWRATE